MDTQVHHDLPVIRWTPWTFSAFPFLEWEEQRRLESVVLLSRNDGGSAF
jgi:hypothetical protein